MEKEEDEEDLEGNLLGGRPHNTIPARYESNSDESVTFPNLVMEEGCCQADSAR